MQTTSTQHWRAGIMPGWLSSMPAGKLVVGGSKIFQQTCRSLEEIIRHHARMVKLYASCYKNHQARFTTNFCICYWALPIILLNIHPKFLRCGYCQNLSPTFKELASEMASWRDVIQVQLPFYLFSDFGGNLVKWKIGIFFRRSAVSLHLTLALAFSLEEASPCEKCQLLWQMILRL